MDGLYKRDNGLAKVQNVELNGDKIIQLCDPNNSQLFNSFWNDMRQVIGACI
jgi:hypothetical protein